MDELNLKKNDDGQVVLVTVNTQEYESPFDVEEIKRQIKQHAELLQCLESQLKAVQDFKDSKKTATKVTPVESQDSIINTDVLAEKVEPAQE